MARHRRLCVPGIPAHLGIRGNDRQDIFRSEGDRIFFHRTLCELAGRYGFAVHAYVFMTNHIHLVATPSREDSFARTFQTLGRRYVPRFNKLYHRTGTLWEGRYESSVIDSDRYLLNCHRYVELNPVRARMVGAPGDYEWSSFRCNAWGIRDDLVVPHSLYIGLAADESARLDAYARLFDSELPLEVLNEIRDAIGWSLGSAEFQQELEAEVGRRVARVYRRRRRVSGEIDSDPIHGQGTARTVAVG